MGLVLIANIVPLYHTKVTDVFFNQFEKDMMYAQQYALVNEEPVYVLFETDKHQYKIEVKGPDEILLIRDYNSKVKLEAYALSNRIIFNRNGSIQKSGTMFVSYKNNNYKVIFYLGKGRFKVEQL